MRCEACGQPIRHRTGDGAEIWPGDYVYQVRNDGKLYHVLVRGIYEDGSIFLAQTGFVDPSRVSSTPEAARSSAEQQYKGRE
jgi:hypothetical protein